MVTCVAIKVSTAVLTSVMIEIYKVIPRQLWLDETTNTHAFSIAITQTINEKHGKKYSDSKTTSTLNTVFIYADNTKQIYECQTKR